jgi:fatty acid desaturase
MTSVPVRKHAALNNALLLLQLPLAVVMLITLVSQLEPGSGSARWVSGVVGQPATGYDSFGQGMAAAAAVGFFLSTNVVVAHELMHRRSRFWKSCSRLLLIITGDAQFQEAHLYGHHANVATPRDPAAARRGESLYRFSIRSTAGQWLDAYAFERKRLRDSKGLGKLVRNRVLRGNLATAGLLALTGSFVGTHAMLGYLLVMIMSKFLLESLNYIQHYGLVRDRGMKVQPKHSWDCSSRGASMALFNLTRHSEHHANPTLPFWELENHEEAPQLIHGYILTFFVALIPPFWFRYMEPRLQALEGQVAGPQEQAVPLR